jgi:predicted ester cyclase
MKQYMSPDFVFYYKDGQIGIQDFFDLVQAIVDAFPDFQWSVASTTVDGNKVTQHFDGVCGTHTGAPFGLGSFPKIEATGVAVKNDPETQIVEVEGDKVKSAKVKLAKVVAGHGPMSGPPGIYVQIGGKME